LADQIKKNELGRACNTYCGEERFWWGNLRERARFEHPDIDAKITFIWIFRKREGRGHGLD
jgi:hypothetical protein